MSGHESDRGELLPDPSFGMLAHDVEIQGLDPEIAADIDPNYLVPVPNITAEDLMTEEDFDLLEKLEEQAKQDDINANSRKTYLIQLIQEVGSQRGMEGFAVNHVRVPDTSDYRTNVESKNYRKQLEGKETLDRACDVCVWAGHCAIERDIAGWTATHPYAKSDSKLPYSWQRFPGVKRAEGRMKFLKRLDADSRAHCIPEPADELTKAA